MGLYTVRNYLQFLTSSWALLAFGFASIFWGNFGQSFFISWYGASIQDSLDLSAGRYGGIYAAATLSSGLLIMIFGGMIDRWPLRRFVTWAALGLALACLAMAVAVNPLSLFVGFFLVRLCGQGLLPHTAQTTMARFFDAHRGKALSISASGVPLGEALLPAVAVMLIAWLGWRASWVVVSLSVLVLYLPLAFWLLRRAHTDTSAAPLSLSAELIKHSAGRREMLMDYRFWLALPTALAGPFMITAVFIHQGFILEEKGWSAAWLATCFIALAITHWVSSLASGLMVDLFSARRLLPFTLVPLLTALACLIWVHGAWSALPFMMLLGMSIGLSSPVLGALWAEVYGTAKLGSIRSLMSSLMILSTAASPLLFGVLIDRGVSLTGLFGGAALGLVAALIMVLFSYRAEPREGV